MEEYKLLRDPKTETIRFFGPYNATFVKALKKRIGSARWDPISKSWNANLRDEAAFKSIILDVYGWSEDDPIELVSADITFKREVYADRESIQMFNKTIARAYGRDSGATLGEDVSVVSGRFVSGGSRNNWDTRTEAGTHIQLHNIQKSIFQRLLQREKEKWDAEIELYEPDIVSKKSLYLQKQKLQEQLNALNQQIADLGDSPLSADKKNVSLALFLNAELNSACQNDLNQLLENNMTAPDGFPIVLPAGNSYLMRVLPDTDESQLPESLRTLNQYARGCHAQFIRFCPEN